MAAEERLSRLDSQVSMDAAPPEIDPVVQESGQTPVAGGNDVHAEIDREDSNLELPKNESSFLFRSDSCSSFEDGTWLRELEKYKKISIEYYDVLVIFCEENKHDARRFCDHLKNDIKLNCNEFVKAVLYDELVPQAGSKFRLLEIALERCTYIFFYITKEFCEDKKWIEFCRDACLMETIENEEKRWCLVPVNTVPKKTADFRLPFGLRALKGIDYYDNNPYYQAFVSGLIQNKLLQRLDKEKKQKEEQLNWVQNNMRTSPVGDENIRDLENKEKLRIKQQEKQKITEQAVIESFNHSQPMLLQKTGVQTGTDPQPSSTASERRESSDKGYHRGQSGESISQENDPTYNKSIESTDQLSQGGSISHMEPASHKFSTSDNLTDMPPLNGKDSTVVSSSINSYTGEKRPQEESPTGTTIDELFCSHSSILDKAMAAEERLSRLDSQVSMDAAPPEIDPVVQESGQTPVGLQTGTDPHEQRSNTASERRRSNDKGYHRGQSGESISQVNDLSYNNSIESTDQLSQRGNTNHMEPGSHKFSTSGNLSDMPLHDGQNSTVASSSINSYTGMKRSIQEASITGATISKWVQTDPDPQEQPSSIACRKRRDSDTGYHSDQSGESVSQENDPTYNTSKESTDQRSQEGSTNHMKPAFHTGLQDIGALSLNPSEDGMSLTSDQSQDSQMTPVNQSLSCWVPSVSQSPCIQETLVSQSEKSDTSCTLLHTCLVMPFVQVARRPAAPLLNRPSLITAKMTPLVQSDSIYAQPIPPGEDPQSQDELD